MTPRFEPSIAHRLIRLCRAKFGPLSRVQGINKASISRHNVVQKAAWRSLCARAAGLPPLTALAHGHRFSGTSGSLWSEPGPRVAGRAIRPLAIGRGRRPAPTSTRALRRESPPELRTRRGCGRTRSLCPARRAGTRRLRALLDVVRRGRVRGTGADARVRGKAGALGCRVSRPARSCD